jgi:5-methylcytosine-specific restriction endonuclease McrA
MVSRPRWCKCGKELTSHLDHKIPRAQGGTDDPSNLQWLGARCHSKKTASTDGGFGNAIAKIKQQSIEIAKAGQALRDSGMTAVITGLAT